MLTLINPLWKFRFWNSVEWCGKEILSQARRINHYLCWRTVGLIGEIANWKKTKALFPRYFTEPLELKPWKMQWRRSYNEALFLPICVILSYHFIGDTGELNPFNFSNLLEKLLKFLNLCMLYDWITFSEFDNDHYLNKTNLLH